MRDSKDSTSVLEPAAHRAALTAVQSDLILLIERLDNMRRYALINTIAVIKISKKHDKHIPGSQLMQTGKSTPIKKGAQAHCQAPGRRCAIISETQFVVRQTSRQCAKYQRFVCR
jgi:hypothetical protein